MVSAGFNRAFGTGLRRFIARSTSNRVKSVFSGALVAVCLQSSTASALIITSFTARGMVAVSGAVAFMLGADVGTTIAAQVLSFDLGFLTPVVIIIGFIVTKVMGGGQYKHIGRALIGIGLILLSLQMIVSSSEPLRDSEVLHLVFGSLNNEPFLAVILAALITWMAHSSLAMVLLFMSLTAAGTISVSLGLAFVLGANMGGAIAALVMTMSAEVGARRVPLSNLLIRMFSAMICLPFLGEMQSYLLQVDADPARMIVNFHTAFNIALAVFFLPFTGVVSILAKTMLPSVAVGEAENSPRYLDKSALSTPPAALACVARETLRISDIIQRMLRDTLEALKKNNMPLINKIREKDDTVDELYEEVKRYLAQISQTALDQDESRRYMQILGFSTNLEHIGDIIDKNLMELAAKKVRHQAQFSEEGFAEISSVHSDVMENMRLAQNIFMTSDTGMARRLVEEKATVRNKEISASVTHLQRLREGVKDAMATSSLHMDILRDLRRINSYITVIAYPILEESGELRSSRLRQQEKKLVKTPEEGGEVEPEKD